MRSHRLVSHTADARAEIAGDGLRELFRAALEALGELQTGEPAASPAPATVRETVQIEAADATALLVDFLSEALTRSLARRAVFTDAGFESLDEHRVSATLLGRPVEGFARDVKAVTYHEAEIERDAGGVCRTRLVFDV